MNPSQMAAGPQQPPNVQASPTGQVTGPDPQKIKMALEAAIKQCVNQQGYVDMNKLISVWPQIAQQMGIDVPFQTVLQMIQQDPSLVEDIINQMGLAGIIVNGKMISADELLQQAQGSGGAAGGAPNGTPAGSPNPPPQAPMPPQGA